MTDVALAGPSLRKFRSASTEAPAACAPLIAVAVAFLFFFLLLPLAIVFFEAFRSGLPTFIEGITEKDALAAIKLTLIVAAISVPANLVFARSLMGDRQVRVQGQKPADHSDRSAVLGFAGNLWPYLCAPSVRRGSSGRGCSRTTSRSSSRRPASCLPPSSSPSRSSRAS